MLFIGYFILCVSSYILVSVKEITKFKMGLVALGSLIGIIYGLSVMISGFR